MRRMVAKVRIEYLVDAADYEGGDDTFIATEDLEAIDVNPLKLVELMQFAEEVEVDVQPYAGDA